MRTILFALLLAVGASTVHAGSWPRTYTVNGMMVTIYQPQPESLKGAVLTGRAAMSVRKGSAEPVFGAFFFTALLETDREKHTLTLTKLDITNMRITGMEDATITTITDALEGDIVASNFVMTQEELAATLEDAQREDLESKDLKNEPPVILVAEKPTMVVICEGEPSFKAIETATGVERVINTVAPILRTNGLVYIPNGETWYVAKDVKGPYAPTKDVPSVITGLVQRSDDPDAPPPTKTIVDIVIATTPTEAIVSEGAPKYKAIVGTDLLMMTNTENNVFVDTKTNKTYVLFSGRWFSAASLKGPWTFISSDKLPQAFKSITPSSEAGDVRPFVAGTNEALDAVLDAYIPQTAAVDRKTASLTVQYDGTPKFEPIGTTGMLYAVNTTTSVLSIGGVYYAVDNGVWFRASSPTGPWSVSDVRPKEVDQLPASSPVYNVKYVYVYDVTPTVVYVGYTPGYMGTYIYGPTIVYGTGYWYHGWWGPYYYPHPYTYGFHMHYNPWYGWGGGFSWGYGWMHMSFHYGGYHGWYRPWHSPCWGPSRYRPPYHFGSPNRPNPYVRPAVAKNPNLSKNLYSRPTNPNRSAVSTRDLPSHPAAGGSLTKPSTSPSVRPDTRPTTTPAPSTKPKPELKPTSPTTKPVNNVFATPDGNVVKKDGQNWQQRDANQWKPSQSPQTRDAQQRDRSASSSTRMQPSTRPASSPARSGGVRRSR